MKKFASILLSMLMATGAIAAASAETYTGTAQGIGMACQQTGVAVCTGDEQPRFAGMLCGQTEQRAEIVAVRPVSRRGVLLRAHEVVRADD